MSSSTSDDNDDDSSSVAERRTRIESNSSNNRNSNSFSLDNLLKEAKTTSSSSSDAPATKRRKLGGSNESVESPPGGGMVLLDHQPLLAGTMSKGKFLASLIQQSSTVAAAKRARLSTAAAVSAARTRLVDEDETLLGRRELLGNFSKHEEKEERATEKEEPNNGSERPTTNGQTFHNKLSSSRQESSITTVSKATSNQTAGAFSSSHPLGFLFAPSSHSMALPSGGGGGEGSMLVSATTSASMVNNQQHQQMPTVFLQQRGTTGCTGPLPNTNTNAMTPKFPPPVAAFCYGSAAPLQQKPSWQRGLAAAVFYAAANQQQQQAMLGRPYDQRQKDELFASGQCENGGDTNCIEDNPPSPIPLLMNGRGASSRIVVNEEEPYQLQRSVVNLQSKRVPPDGAPQKRHSVVGTGTVIGPLPAALLATHHHHQQRHSPATTPTTGCGSGSGEPTLTCSVCGDVSSGKHYGILACNGCSGFFKRSVRRGLIYRCQAGTGTCVVDKSHRNQCQACRLNKCIAKGMNKDAVQNERQPRNTATIQLGNDISGFFPEHAKFLSSAVFSSSSNGDHRKLLENGVGQCGPLIDVDHQQTSTTQRRRLSVVDQSAASQAVLVATSTRLLFSAIRSAKNMPQFAMLPASDQKTLLEAFWPDLFLLAAFQFSSDCSMIPTATNENGCSGGSLGGEEESKLEVQHQQKPTTTGCALLDCPTTVRLIPEDLVSGLRALLQRFRQACPDSAELACLRALTLFQSEIPDLQYTAFVEQLQDQALLMLQQHAAQRYPPSFIRFGRLLLLLSAVRGLASKVRQQETYLFSEEDADGGARKLIGDFCRSS